MSPKVPNPVEPNERQRDVKELLYNGYLYDVTDWIKNHPGGNVIKFYTEPGEDATQVIEQFHFRSKDKVDLVMKYLPKRPAPSIEGDKSQRSAKHEEMNKDFQRLFQELRLEGYFEPSYSETFLRCLEPIAIALIAITMGGSWYMNLFSAVLMAFAMNRFAWIQHECGHRSLTGNRRVDGWIQNVCVCVCLGGSTVWWNSEHNRHHAMPQRVHHDADIQTLPYITWTEKEVTPEKPFNKFFVKYQGILYWTLDLVLFVFATKFYIHPKTQLKKQAYGEMFLNLFSYALMFYYGFFWYFFGSYLFTFSLALSFSLSHSYLEIVEDPTHWVEYALGHTVNIQPSRWCDWWMGYLNYQIEHHLFPSMPQFKLKEVSHRVKILAEKHNLPYVTYGYGEACKYAMTHLYKVGRNIAG